MKIAGKQIGTVRPVSTVDVSVANFRYAADYAYTHSTDTFNSNSHPQAELYAFKRNIPGGVFTNQYYPYANQLNIEETGRIRCDIYFPVDRWKNPNDGSIDLIPDYSDSQWTSAGEAYFNVTAGNSKPTRYPNHGQELYDISGGQYGYDFGTGTEGSNNLDELIGVIEDENLNFEAKFNRKPSAISYRFGKDQGAQLLKDYYLAGRNSDYSDSGDGLTAFGQSKDGSYLGLPNQETNRTQAISRASTTRWRTMLADSSYSKAQATSYAESQIQQAHDNNGVYHNFYHWHFLVQYENDVSYIDDIMSAESSKSDSLSGFCWRTYFGEAFEYKFLRDSVRRLISWESNGDIKIVADFEPAYSNMPVDAFETPITILLDTTGTTLEGADIISYDAEGIRKISVNTFAIDIQYQAMKHETITIEATSSPVYYNFNKPAFNSITESAGTMNVETDIPTRLAVFSSSSGQDTCSVHARSNTLSTDHSIDISSILGDNIWIGAITPERQSVLSATQSFS